MNHNQLIILLESYRNDLGLSISAIVYNDGFNICSINTYRRLIDGESVRDIDHLLIDLFKGIDKKITDFDDTDLYDELYNSITTYDDDLIVSQCDKVLSKLEHLKDYAYYDIVLESIEVIKAYYLNKTYSSEEFYWHYVKFESVMNPKLNDIMYIMFVYSYANGHYSNKVVWENVLNYKSNHIVGLLTGMHLSIGSLNYYEAFKYSQRIEELVDNKQNTYYLKYLSHKIILVKLLNSDFYDLWKEIKDLLLTLENDISSFNKYSIMMNLGYVLLLNKNYDEFISMIENLVAPVNRTMKKDVCLMFAYSQLGLPIDKTNVSNEECGGVLTLSMFYKYFISDDLSYGVKNKMLLSVYKLLDSDDFLFRFIVEEELVKNCSVVKSYKCLYDLHEIKNR